MWKMLLQFYQQHYYQHSQFAETCKGLRMIYFTHLKWFDLKLIARITNQLKQLFQKFPSSKCNLCEHKSRAFAQSKEAPMEKTWHNTDFDIIWRFPCSCNLCEHESRACAQSKYAPVDKTWHKKDFDII